MLHKVVHDLKELVEMANAELDRAVASVEKLESAVDGMVSLLNTLSQLIRDAGDSSNVKAALTKLADDVDAKAQAAAEAIAANTPAAPPAP